MAAVPADKGLFVFGLGHIGKEVAVQASREGWRVTGTIRKGEEKMKGVKCVEYGMNDVGKEMERCSHVLVTIPPVKGGDIVLKNYVKSLRGKKWVGYASSASVYGQTDGRLVSETDAKPKSEKGAVRVAVEAAWKSKVSPVQIFRLAGLYGPSRSIIDRLRSRTARYVEGGEYINRVHHADAASAILLSMNRAPFTSNTYNIADDCPCDQGAVVRYAASLLNMPPPPPTPLSGLPSRLLALHSTSKRLDTSRAKSHLGWRPRFSSYKTGLPSCL
eukprot:TRINITY_DN8103_c0_g1_i1.p1 TRINITY_DN8103_c0_g1~~TRINITY_DN8103_c0_g1_i1.p1  ORF type:complete len:274 (+),score=56.61 TRINITY_DN8103_c0_g1_i1:43-864(+)